MGCAERSITRSTKISYLYYRKFDQLNLLKRTVSVLHILKFHFGSKCNIQPMVCQFCCLIHEFQINSTHITTATKYRHKYFINKCQSLFLNQFVLDVNRIANAVDKRTSSVCSSSNQYQAMLGHKKGGVRQTFKESFIYKFVFRTITTLDNI